MSFTLPTSLLTLWNKFQGWFSAEANAVTVAFTAEEQKVLTALSPILHAAEATTLAAFFDFLRQALTDATQATDLPTLEAKILNLLETEGGQLFTFGKGLGSNLLQAAIAVILADLPKAA